MNYTGAHPKGWAKSVLEGVIDADVNRRCGDSAGRHGDRNPFKGAFLVHDVATLGEARLELQLGMGRQLAPSIMASPSPRERVSGRCGPAMRLTAMGMGGPLGITAKTNRWASSGILMPGARVMCRGNSPLSPPALRLVPGLRQTGWSRRCHAGQAAAWRTPWSAPPWCSGPSPAPAAATSPASGRGRSGNPLFAGP